MIILFALSCKWEQWIQLVLKPLFHSERIVAVSCPELRRTAGYLLLKFLQHSLGNDPHIVDPMVLHFTCLFTFPSNLKTLIKQKLKMVIFSSVVSFVFGLSLAIHSGAVYLIEFWPRLICWVGERCAPVCLWSPWISNWSGWSSCLCQATLPDWPLVPYWISCALWMNSPGQFLRNLCVTITEEWVIISFSTVYLFTDENSPLRTQTLRLL